MEIHQLRYFLAVAQTGSFTAAAAACNVSQPTLSAQIAKLEDELGGQLIERSRRGAKLSQWGELFKVRAAEALRQLESGRIELEELSGLRRGSVTLGCLPTTGAHLLPKILTAFGQAYPHIQVNLREESSPVLARSLLDAEVDLAIMDEAGFGQGHGLQAETLFTEPLLIVVAPTHALAKAPKLALSILANEPMILMKSGHGFRTIVLDALHRAGVNPRIVYESAEIETIQALVQAGLGISLVPEMVRKEQGLVYINISAPTPFRTVLLASRDQSTLSPAAAAMKQVALQCFKPPM
jgi:LysR family hydrogen peroxide-inducible transcriptional activator